MGFHLQLSNMKFLQIDESDWHDNPHSHDDVYQISVPFSGKLITSLDSNEKILENGRSIIANPLSTHFHQFESGNNSMMIVGLNRHALNKWFQDAYKTIDEVEFDENQILFPNELKKQLKKWVGKYLLTGDYQYSLVTELEDDIFQYFASSLKGSHNTRNGQSTPSNISLDYHINLVLEYMHSFYYENIKVEKLAKLAQLSKYHFIRTFKRVTQYTPYQYLMLLRIEKGKEMLRLSRKTVTEISYELGFSNPSQFYRNFVNIAGCTPKQFREEIG